VLLPPHQVRPYVTRNKTDRADAKGILEAYRNADIHPVPVKTIPSTSSEPFTASAPDRSPREPPR